LGQPCKKVIIEGLVDPSTTLLQAVILPIYIQQEKRPDVLIPLPKD
jgi:hypothetical protein